jgi:type II secretory pathway pseudopilin PulG
MKRIAGLMKKVRHEDESGFTIVELMMVAIISVIIMAGMVALVSSAFQVFNSSKDLETVTDSSRRSLLAMSRMVRQALHFKNDACTVSKLTFYADINNDQGNTVDVDTWGNSQTGIGYTERVQLMQVGDGIRINVTPPNVAASDTTVATPKLGSYLAQPTGLQFFYFQKGETPTGSDPFNPGNTYGGGDVNSDVGMIRIVLTLHKGNTTRRFFQDVFLRIILRTG